MAQQSFQITGPMQYPNFGVVRSQLMLRSGNQIANLLVRLTPKQLEMMGINPYVTFQIPTSTESGDFKIGQSTGTFKTVSELTPEEKAILQKAVKSPIFHDPKFGTRLNIPFDIENAQAYRKKLVLIKWNKLTGQFEPILKNGKPIVDAVGMETLSAYRDPKFYGPDGYFAAMPTYMKVIGVVAGLAIGAGALGLVGSGTGVAGAGAGSTAAGVSAVEAAGAAAGTATTAGVTTGVGTATIGTATVATGAGAALTSATGATVAGGSAATGVGLMATAKAALPMIATVAGLAKSTGLLPSSTPTSSYPGTSNISNTPNYTTGSALGGIPNEILYIGGGLILLTILITTLRR